MSKKASLGLFLLSLMGLNSAIAGTASPVTSYVDLATSSDTITVGLYGSNTPITVKNFLAYVNANLYSGTIIHRSDHGFVIQGGWLNIYGQPITRFPPIPDEAGSSKLSNIEGTIAMARTNDPHSATSQFFFNLANNASQLDYGSQNAPDGYAVFGAVAQGSSVMSAIGNLTPFNLSSLPFPVTPDGQMVIVQGAFAYSVDAAATPGLRILFAGTGSGTVKSAPGGICKKGPCSYPVKAGQKVNLTATADSGSYFTGWSGDCWGGNRTLNIKTSTGFPSSTNCIATFTRQ